MGRTPRTSHGTSSNAPRPIKRPAVDYTGFKKIMVEGVKKPKIGQVKCERCNMVLECFGRRDLENHRRSLTFFRFSIQIFINWFVIFCTEYIIPDLLSALILTTRMPHLLKAIQIRIMAPWETRTVVRLQIIWIRLWGRSQAVLIMNWIIPNKYDHC